MAGVISIGISAAQERQLTATLAGIRGAIPRATASAINKTLGKTRTRILKRVATGSKLTQKVVRPSIKVIKAKSSVRPISGKIRLLNFNIALAKQARSKPPAGGSYALSKVGEPRPLPHPSFRAKLASGHVGFFVRQGVKVKPSRGKYANRVIKRGKRKGQPILRQKIYEVYGTSPRKFFETAPGIAQEELSAIAPELQKQFDAAIAFEIFKAAK